MFNCSLISRTSWTKTCPPRSVIASAIDVDQTTSVQWIYGHSIQICSPELKHDRVHKAYLYATIITVNHSRRSFAVRGQEVFTKMNSACFFRFLRRLPVRCEFMCISRGVNNWLINLYIGLLITLSHMSIHIIDHLIAAMNNIKSKLDAQPDPSWLGELFSRILDLVHWFAALHHR